MTEQSNFHLASLFNSSPTLQLLISFRWSRHLQIQVAYSPSLPWTKFACWRSSMHHLYSDVGIYRSGAGREGASRPRHRLKKHAEDGWLRKRQVVQCGCSLSSNTSLPLGSASSKFHTLTAHQALRRGFFSYLKPNTFWPKPFSSYTWNVGHPAFCQAQNLCPNTLDITNLHQMVPKWSLIHSLLSVPTPTAGSCSFTGTTAEPQCRLSKCRLPQPAQSAHQCEAFPTPSLSPAFSCSHSAL